MSATSPPRIQWYLLGATLIVIAAVGALVTWIGLPPRSGGGAPVPITVIGDSYTAGTTQDSGPSARWPTLVERSIDVRMQLLAAGGSGYLRAGPYKPEMGTFGSRVVKVQPGAKVVIFFGSVNDRAESTSKIRDASLRAFQEIRRQNPAAQLVVVGPPQVRAFPESQVLKVTNALRVSAAACGASWVDPVSMGWLQKSGDIGADGIHPTDQGQRRLAGYFSAIIESELRGG